MEQHLFLIHFYLPRLPAPPPLLEPPPPRPIPPPRLVLLLPPPKDERELPDLLPDDEVREVRAGRDDRDATDGLGGLGGLGGLDGLDVGMNIGRVLFRDLRKLLFLLPKKMEVMMSSTNTTRKTIRAILILRAKSLAADV